MSEKKTEQIMVVCDLALRNAVEAAARDADVSLSAWARWAIREKLIGCKMAKIAEERSHGD